MIFKVKNLWQTVVLILLLSSLAWAQQGYLKLTRDQAGLAQNLKTGIARFTSADGRVIDLIAVIHVGETSYYQRLNKHFAHYQSVLYEMVLDVPQSFKHQNDIRDILGRDKREPKIDTRQGGKDSLSLFQKKLSQVLGLTYQLDVIDYTVDNFRHADLTLAEFDKAMASKKQSPLTMLKSLLESGDTASPSEYKKIAKLPLIKILSDGPTLREQQIIRLGLAAYFAQSKDMEREFQGDVLIGLRNKKAIEILQKRLDKGDKKIAIFYGAAHMPDFSRRLKSMGFKAVSINWVSAWDLQL